MRSRRTVAIILMIVGLLLLSILGIVFVLQPGGGNGNANEAAATPAADTGAPTEVPRVTIDPEELSLRYVVVANNNIERGVQIALNETDIEVIINNAKDNPNPELLGGPAPILAIEKRSTASGNVIAVPDPNIESPENIEALREALSELDGLYARTAVFQGETLTLDSLVGDVTLVGQETTGPSSLIPAGFVAAAVPMDRLSSVAYGLAAGDSIDVMFTFVFAEIDEEFQTLLPNSLAFILSPGDLTADETDDTTQRLVFIIDPYGRFEQLANGDTAHIAPSTVQQPIPVSFIIQNAKVIQVGPWTPPGPPRPPTPTPDPNQPTATPGGQPPTPTPPPPDVLVIAMRPQEQLLMKYAVEHFADIDFALRGINDGQLYPVVPVDLGFLLQRFNIEVPPNYNFVVVNPEDFVVSEQAESAADQQQVEQTEFGPDDS